MNKYTKNKIFFNLEKIIALSTVISIVILTMFCMSSCTTSQYTYHKSPVGKTPSHTCPAYK